MAQLPIQAGSVRGVLITRPEPGDAETAAAFAALGWQPLLAPALTLAPRAMARPDPPLQGLLLTSRAAARAMRGVPPGWPGESPLRDLPTLTVGEATATEARAAGLTRVEAAAGDAAALVELAAARFVARGTPLVLAVGEGYGHDLARQLRARGFSVQRRVVYAARPARALPEAALAALRESRVAAAVFTSPRGAEVTMSLLRRAGLGATVTGMVALALSPRIAAALAGMPWREIRATPAPEASALPALLGRAPSGA